MGASGHTDSPRPILAICTCIIALAHSGKLEEAKQTFSELKKVKPDFSRAFISETIWFRHEADLEFVIEGLRMAGMED